jgi:Icc-related predicted phosphoesterase
MVSGSTVRIAAVGDLHVTKTSAGSLQPLFARVADSANVLLLAGDLTNTGTPDEARVLAKELVVLHHTPVIAVLGNHDLESQQGDEVCRILSDAGVTVLDGDAHEIHGVGIAGIKGFCGGFGPRALAPWGEQIIKQFVREAVDEALKLESALARLRTEHRVALLHYAPIRQTVDREPLEIRAFLGSSRLEEPLSRYPVSFVVHGHAHNGSLEGVTQNGVPVYNVSLPLLNRSFTGQPPIRIFDIQVGSSRVAAHPTPADQVEKVG